MHGILLVDKPSGWTSFDVVAKVRGLLRTETRKQELVNREKPLVANSSLLVTPSPKVKVGHAGTLDPLATGLMVILVGSYCKRAQEFSKLDKVYEVTMRLGQTSTTGDEEGEKTVASERVPSGEELQASLIQFTGEIMQTPPIYSAIKVNGQRAYKLARAGQAVKLEPRMVRIYSTELTDYAYPEVKFTTKVSSGTYIRSLVEDIGSALGTGAYMSGLRRISVGDFELTSSVTTDQLDIAMITQKLITLPEQSK